MTTLRKTTLTLAGALLSLSGVAVTHADDGANGTSTWPGQAAPRWGFPPVVAEQSTAARVPQTPDQQFAALAAGNWPGSQESRWGYPHGSDQGAANAPGAAAQWAAVEAGTWPGLTESRWGQAHVTGPRSETVQRRAAADDE